MPAPDDEPLQVADDPRFQAMFWRVERIAWLAFAALLIAAVLGFTGSGGLFARTSITTAHGEIDYPRVGRWSAPDRIEIKVPAGEPARIGLGSAFLGLFDIRSITPPPDRSELHGDGLTLHFLAAEGAAAAGAAAGHSTIILHVVPTRPAFGAAAELTVGPDDPARLSVTVLP